MSLKVSTNKENNKRQMTSSWCGFVAEWQSMCTRIATVMGWEPGNESKKLQKSINNYHSSFVIKLISFFFCYHQFNSSDNLKKKRNSGELKKKQ